MGLARMFQARSWRHVLFHVSGDGIPDPERQEDLSFANCTGLMIPGRYRSFFLEFGSRWVLLRTNLWMLQGRAWFFVTSVDGTPANYVVAYDSKRARRRFPDVGPGGVIFGPVYTRSAFRGKSITPFALRSAVGHFVQKGVHDFYIDCAESNLPSKRSIEKAGFAFRGTYEGTTGFLGRTLTSCRVSA